MEMQTATGLGEKNSWDILFQVNSVEKHLMFHRTNRCLGCVGYIYVGQIYQNRGESLGDFKYQLWLPEIAYPAFKYTSFSQEEAELSLVTCVQN